MINTTKCAFCGTTKNLERHHLLCGAQRGKADKYGLVIDICHTCHMRVHASPELMEKCRKFGQKKFEKTRTREEFIQEFGRNYL